MQRFGAAVGGGNIEVINETTATVGNTLYYIKYFAVNATIEITSTWVQGELNSRKRYYASYGSITISDYYWAIGKAYKIWRGICAKTEGPVRHHFDGFYIDGVEEKEPTPENVSVNFTIETNAFFTGMNQTIDTSSGKYTLTNAFLTVGAVYLRDTYEVFEEMPKVRVDIPSLPDPRKDKIVSPGKDGAQDVTIPIEYGIIKDEIKIYSSKSTTAEVATPYNARGLYLPLTAIDTYNTSIPAGTSIKTASAQLYAVITPPYRIYHISVPYHYVTGHIAFEWNQVWYLFIPGEWVCSTNTVLDYPVSTKDVPIYIAVGQVAVKFPVTIIITAIATYDFHAISSPVPPPPGPPQLHPPEVNVTPPIGGGIGGEAVVHSEVTGVWSMISPFILGVIVGIVLVYVLKKIKRRKKYKGLVEV